MDIWHNRLIIPCPLNHSKLTPGSCQINQQQALEGARLLLSGKSVHSVPEHQVERLVTCGSCQRANVKLPMGRVMRKLKQEFELVAQKLDEFDWWAHDADVREDRRVQRNWRETERRAGRMDRVAINSAL